MAVGIGAAQTSARLVRTQSQWERARTRLTWLLVCLVAPLVKPFAQRLWPLSTPVQVTLTLIAEGYSWDAAICDLIALAEDAPAKTQESLGESLGWRVDIAEDHWGDLHYTAAPRTPQDTRPTLETLAEARATSPLAHQGGAPLVRYRRLIEDDPTCELVAAIADLPTAPLLPAIQAPVQPAAADAEAVAGSNAAEWRPAQAGSLSVASLIDTGAQRHLDDLWWGMQQPATQPLPAALRQQRSATPTPATPTTPTPVTVPVLTPVREEVEVPASC